MQVASLLERLVSQTNAYEADLTKAAGPYDDLLNYAYPPTDTPKRTFVLVVTEKTARFNLWVGVNSAGTKCACDGKVCTSATAGTFTATQKTCTSPTVAF